MRNIKRPLDLFPNLCKNTHMDKETFDDLIQIYYEDDDYLRLLYETYGGQYDY